jgi:hypothetical protein
MRLHVEDMKTLRSIGCPEFRVYLDGREIREVFAFDDEEGWIHAYETNAEGRVVRGRDGPITICLKGRVTLKAIDSECEAAVRP